MKNPELVKEYLNQLISLINKLKVNGENIEDQRIVEKIL